MIRAVLITSSLFIVLASCSTKKTITTKTTITERIDTAIAIPPSQYVNEIPVRELLKKPQTIDNERASVVIHYDTIRDVMKVKTYVKPDTVVVEKIRTITKNETITKREPRTYSRWKWFAAGAIAMLIFVLVLRFRA